MRVRLFLQDGSEYSEPGEIAYWSNRVNTNTGTFQLQAVFPNPKRQLMAGMFVRVNIGPADPHKSLLIPLVALMSDQAGDYVYVVEPDGRVARRNLELGYRDSRNIIVKSGLKAGERVIVEGTQKVRPGSPALPETDPGAGRADSADRRGRAEAGYAEGGQPGCSVAARQHARSGRGGDRGG